MGNRAHVIFTDDTRFEGEIGPAVYLHWNGGPESVYQFLHELEVRNVRPHDVQYNTARFIQVVADYFGIGDGLSLGVRNGPATLTLADLNAFDPGDNGIYVVGWRPKTGKQFVRRFRSAGYNQGLQEMSARGVAAERRLALRMNEYGGIQAAYETFRAQDALRHGVSA